MERSKEKVASSLYVLFIFVSAIYLPTSVLFLVLLFLFVVVLLLLRAFSDIR